MRYLWLTLLVVSLKLQKVQLEDCNNKAEVVCYFASWALYRLYDAQFNTEDIDPTLCTRIIYSFAGLDIDLHIASLDLNADITLGGFHNLTTLKEQNPCLRTSLALGGWNEGSLKYSIMASSEESRKEFAETALKFIAYYGFDGLDLDWEYPTSQGGIPDDKKNFVSLLQIIKEKFSPWGLSLSIAVGMEEQYYDVESIANYVDYVHMMAYDMVHEDSNVTGLLAPLSVIKEKVNAWINNGLDPKKLILGIPTYARCFNLENKDDHAIGNRVVSNTTCGGVWTDQDGFLAYFEVEQFVLSGQCQGTIVSDSNVYSWCDDVWMTYDNEESVTLKAQYVLETGLGGLMVWSLDTDDFMGLYGQKYPLLNSIYSTLNGEGSNLY